MKDKHLSKYKTQPSNGTVFIVEDDPSLCWTISHTLKSNGFTTVEFQSATAFFASLESFDLTKACLILDMRLPDMSGLEVQERLELQKISLPIIFISGNSQISEAISGLKNGAVDFLLKPFDYEAIVGLVRSIFSKMSLSTSTKNNQYNLTPRELLVLDYISKGWRSEQISKFLGITVRTIKMHRSNIIQKTGANTITEAVIMILQSAEKSTHDSH